MDEETLALEVRKYVSKNDQRLYHMIREEYQQWLVKHNGSFLDFLLWQYRSLYWNSDPQG